MEHPNQCRGKLNTNICNTDLNCFPVGENGPHVEKGEAETQYRHALQFRAKTGRVCGRGSLRGCCSNIARGGRCLESLDIFVKSGLNPSEEEVRRLSNQVWDGSGKVSWPLFAGRLGDLLAEKAGGDPESGYRETFRVFSKNEGGCIPMEEIKFVMSQVAPEEVST